MSPRIVARTRITTIAPTGAPARSGWRFAVGPVSVQCANAWERPRLVHPVRDSRRLRRAASPTPLRAARKCGGYGHPAGSQASRVPATVAHLPRLLHRRQDEVRRSSRAVVRLPRLAPTAAWGSSDVFRTVWRRRVPRSPGRRLPQAARVFPEEPVAAAEAKPLKYKGQHLPARFC